MSRPTLSPNDPRHGTTNGYSNYYCRCEPCRQANSQYKRERTARPCAAGCGRSVYGRYRPGAMCRSCRSATMTIPLGERHGTEVGYDKGCRCGPCTHAMNAARAERRKRPNPAKHGTHTSYSNGCRCADCRDGHNAYNRERRRSA